ncbi:DNA cytosine methyltransferase [Pseudomonas rhizophila]|uniref:DNA cytosine methyltransferase n=1 Tax=Pseudomonas rhizophila TaxID=2045200 RepID=UPI0030DCE01C
MKPQKKSYSNFITSQSAKRPTKFNFLSLFSGAGIGDYGLKLAGGNCIGACEIDPSRAAVHYANIGSKVWGNLRTENIEIIKHYQGQAIDLLIATPPCQSFSTANSRRGLREDPDHASKDERNSLFFEALHIARALKPSVIFFENVPNFLKRQIRSENGKIVGRVHEFIDASLADYSSWQGTLCFSKFGVPQRRKRSIAIFVRNDLKVSGDILIKKYLSPDCWSYIPEGSPKSILQAIEDLPELDGYSEITAISPNDPLHQVPVYTDQHYSWISNIAKGSGKSAWENACIKCGCDQADFFEIECVSCGEVITTRPHIKEKNGTIRAIKGFKTSYKRMPPDTLAPTITTASGHFSSDLKLHPIQNRVLSARECARLQTIPDTFQWPVEQKYRKGYLFREMIGEAVPPLVTYQFGTALTSLLKSIKL